MKNRTFKPFVTLTLAAVLALLTVCAGQAEPLHIISSVWLDSFDKYVSPSGEQPAVNYEMESIEDLINTRLLTQDSSVDLFVFCAYDELYLLKQKKYCTPLNESAVLTEKYRQLYPAFQKLVCNEDGELVCWNLFSQPLVMTEDTELLRRLGLKSPETFGEMIDTCLALEASEDYPAQDYRFFGGIYSFDQASMLECYLDFYLTCGQQNGRSICFETEDFIENVNKIRDCVPAADPSEGEEWVFDIPAAFEGVNMNMLPVPKVMKDADNAVETISVVAVVNPFSDHKEEAIAFLEWCASRQTFNRYFSDAGLTEPMINPTMAERKEQAEARLARLKAAEPTEEILQQIEETEKDLGTIEENLYYITEEEIAWYRDNLAGQLYISEGRHIMYDEKLDLYCGMFLEGSCTAEELAHACQEHINMVYAELY